MRRRGVVLAASACGITLVGVAHRWAAAGWEHERHDAGASARSDESGVISSESGYEPGISHAVVIDERPLGHILLRDVDIDGTPEALMIHEGRASALDLTTGAFRWKSKVNHLDEVLRVGDYTAAQDDEVLLAVSGDLDGGVFAIELTMGGGLGSLGTLTDRTGIDDDELMFTDLDGDQRDELVFTAAVSGIANVWAASLADGYDTGERAEHPFTGYANWTPPRAGRLLAGGGLAVNVDQSAQQTLLAVCGQGDPGAMCDGPDPAALCLCEEAVFSDVYPGHVFGQSHVVDVDGDGVDEVVSVASHAGYQQSISVLSFADGLAMGQPDTAALRRWVRAYPGGVPDTVLVTPEQPPVDLDGDGSVDLVVSFVNDVALDVDEQGAPVDDGIDLPGAVAFAVFSAATGDVLATRENEFAYGWVDLDGDGAWEILTSPTSGWAFQSGLAGLGLDCSNGCQWVPHWTAPDRRIHPDISAVDGLGVPTGPSWLRMGVLIDPPVTLHVLDADDDGDEELLAYHGGLVEALGWNGVGLQVVASAPLPAGATVRALDADREFLAVADDATIQLRRRDLSPVTAAVPVPPQGLGSWFAFRPRPSEPAVAPVFARTVYPGGLDAPQQAIELPGRFVLAEDLDGDGSSEVLAVRLAGDEEATPGFEFSLLGWDPDAADLVPVWSHASVGDPDLEGAILYHLLHAATGDFDGEGARDVAWPVIVGGQARFVVLDGDTGTTDAVLAATTTPATLGPAVVADLAGADGSLGADGLDDVVIGGTHAVQLLPSGHPGPISYAPNGIGHGAGLNADLDGDGLAELVGMINATTTNAIEAHSAVPPHAALWGPRPLGRPPGRTPVLAAAMVDGDAGLDLLYATGDGSIEAYGGLDGEVVGGFPVYVLDGELGPALPAEPEVATAIAVVDVDGDGHDEAIVGTRPGWLYAVNVASADADPPTLEWAFELGSGVMDLAIADVDSDAEAEVLVSTRDGQGLVVDSLGVLLEITEPGEGECLGVVAVQVEGTATNIVTVDLDVNAIPGDQGIDATSGTWTGQVDVFAPGEHLIKATGRNLGGDVVAIATREVAFGGDEDEDGYEACGECDDADPSRHPGAEEICGDGIDQDCDGDDPPCAEGDDEGESEEGEVGDTSETAGADGDEGSANGGCGCRADSGPSLPRRAAAIALVGLLAVRRRRE
jgi:MYXO-CTERM domain-containing protein